MASPSGAKPPLATDDTTTTQTAHSVPPTSPTATTAATAANCLDHRKQPIPASPSFTMNAIPGRLAEIANQGPPLETTATSRLDCHVPDR